MRIIGGTHKGRRFHPPRTLPVRPTTDFSKESFINILMNYFEFSETKVLDLFAGTGNISYELASQGCPDITAVDSDRGCIKFIEKTAEEFDFKMIDVVQYDVVKFLKETTEQYNLIFADPPYGFKLIEQLVELVFERKLLSENGWFVLEHEPKLSYEKHTHFFQQRKYGSSVFSFFKN